MQKVGDITNTATPEGEFTDGNVAGGTNPTLLMALWFNTIQRELCNVVTESGGTLDPNDFSQVYKAIQQIAQGEIPSNFVKSVNNKSPDVSGDVSLGAGDVGAVPDTRKINNKQLNADITLNASDVNAVPPTRKVNNKQLSSDITLNSSDVGAISDEGGNYSIYLRLTGVETLPTEPSAANLSALYSAPSPIQSGSVASGVVNNWYNNQAIYGVIRNASTGITGWGVQINGVTRFTVAPDGSLYSNSDKVATEVFVKQGYVQDIRLGAETNITPGVHTPGYVATTYDSTSQQLTAMYQRPLQKCINSSWYTVGAL